MERHITVEGGYNVRDLGGYLTADGRVTQQGRLIRAGNLDQVTEAGQHTLLRYGLKTVIDLRHAGELREYPDVFERDRRVRYLHLPFSPDDYAGGSDYVRLDEYYCRSLISCRNNVGAIVSAIAESEPGILYHCAVGKDRTGIISALLLGAVGVPAEAIAEDYAETTRHIAHLVEKWREYNQQHGHSMEHFERDVAADAATMFAMLEGLDSEYGGVENYLLTCGVSAAQLACLQSLLLD